MKIKSFIDREKNEARRKNNYKAIAEKYDQEFQVTTFRHQMCNEAQRKTCKMNYILHTSMTKYINLKNKYAAILQKQK